MEPLPSDPSMTDSHRLVRIETLLIGMASSDSDHEHRLRRLEKIVWIGIGVSAAAGSAVGSFIGSIGPAVGGG